MRGESCQVDGLHTLNSLLTRESRGQAGRLDLLPKAHHVFFPISSQTLSLLGEADFMFPLQIPKLLEREFYN